MKRREFVGLAAAATTSLCLPVLAQQRPVRIGWLAFGRNAEGVIDRTLREALAHYGFVEQHNVNFAYRFANGSSAKLLPLADELVALRPNILIGIGGDVVNALVGASKGSIPVVGASAKTP